MKIEMQHSSRLMSQKIIGDKEIVVAFPAKIPLKRGYIHTVWITEPSHTDID